MKKILIAVLVVLFIFAFIRITTSTYENRNRRNNVQAIPVLEYKIMTDFLVQS